MRMNRYKSADESHESWLQTNANVREKEMNLKHGPLPNTNDKATYDSPTISNATNDIPIIEFTTSNPLSIISKYTKINMYPIAFRVWDAIYSVNR